MTNHEIWQAVLAEFELKISKASFTTWFSNTGIKEFNVGHITICVPNKFTKSWLEKKFNSDLIKILERVTSRPVKKIEYSVGNIKSIEEKPYLTESSTGLKPQINSNFLPNQSQKNQQQQTYSKKFGLDTKYAFETFIVGKNNELAHAAAQAVASRPGDAYNPLFIYGGVGLGKTHLLQAVAHAMLKNTPNLKILYISSENFTNEFVTALKEHNTGAFKAKYRGADLLLVDDVQFIGGKEQTQEEFFHTFNALHQQGKQVVLTSDRPPKAIPSLEDRLVSRFEWGMTVDVSQPDLETRTAILQSKCQEKGFDMEEELIGLISASIKSNIRKLEGALNKIIAFHQLKNIPPSKETVQAILSTLEDQGLKKIVTPKELICLVTKFYDISIEDILGKSRQKRLSFPRQIIMYLLREDLNMSYPNIGNELGGRDHTTAIHAHTKIALEIENSPKLKDEIELIKQKAQTYNNRP